MPDICLDVPVAYTVLERFVERCQKGGFVTDEVIKKMPSRFVYERDGHEAPFIIFYIMSKCKWKNFPYSSFLIHMKHV
jgi:programmed cell death protein 4